MTQVVINPRMAELFDAYIRRAVSPDKGTLTQNEACEVYDEIHRLNKEHPELHPVFYLLETLRAETARGKRCSVCAKVNNPDCILGC